MAGRRRAYRAAFEDGQYATNVELEEAHGHERDLIASALWHLRGDLSEEAREQGYLSCLQEYRRGGYPEATARLSEALKTPLSDRLSPMNMLPFGQHTAKIGA